jgi:lactoylglutathione lyase
MKIETLLFALTLCAFTPHASRAEGKHPVAVDQGGPSATLRFDHLALYVADLAVSVTFYSDVLGLQEIPAAAKGTRWLSLGKGVALHLIGGRSAPVADVRSVHFALAGENLDPILQRLRKRHVPWSDSAGTLGAVEHGRSDGVRQIYLRDPDGYWVEVNDALKKKA